MCGIVGRHEVIVFAEFRVGAGEREPVTLLGPVHQQNLLNVANFRVVLFLEIGKVEQYVPVFLDLGLTSFCFGDGGFDRLDHIVVTIHLVQVLRIKNIIFRSRVGLHRKILVQIIQRLLVVFLHRGKLGHRVDGGFLDLLLDARNCNHLLVRGHRGIHVVHVVVHEPHIIEYVLQFVLSNALF